MRILPCHVFTTLLIVLLSSPCLYASIAPPLLVVNHELKQCSTVNLGDECTACELPHGWEKIEACPKDYTTIELESICHPAKRPHCCVPGSSGGPGDCEDVIVDSVKKQCTFVEDISRCQTLPGEWRRAPLSKIFIGTRMCPMNYSWQKEMLECR
ncbi:MAG: hypothetical protein KDD55_00760 [Bdellovibrionales bacterium]|nr:hypothetical protein [Bdellovibrionales bacterium]